MEKEKVYETNSAKETQELAEKIAREILEKGPQERAAVLALQGELGSGKTTFAQGFAKALDVEEKVLSPTFVIVKHYEIQSPHPQSPSDSFGGREKSKINSKFEIQNSKFTNLVHIDCYRIEGEEDLQELGWDSIVSDPKNIVLIEWPERIQEALPENTMYLHFQNLNETTRQISVKY